MEKIKETKLSVCIPTYGRAHVLPKVIGSVLSQTFKDFEVFISDDASPDNTEEVVKGFDDPRIRYHKNKSNLGVRENWNFIIKNAKGEYVFKLDDDDYIHSTFLEKTVSLLEKYPNVGSVYSGFYYAKDYDGRYIEKVIDKALFKSDYIKGIDYVMANLLHTSVPGLHPSSAVFRYSLAEEIGFYDKVKNDLMFSLALASKADVGYVHEPLFYYVQHTNAKASYAKGKDSLYNFEPTKMIKDFFTIDFIKGNAELMKVKDRAIKRERVVRSLLHLAMCRKNFKFKDYLGIALNLVKRDKRLLLSPLFVLSLNGSVLVPKKLMERLNYMYKSKQIFARLAGLFKKD